MQALELWSLTEYALTELSVVKLFPWAFKTRNMETLFQLFVTYVILSCDPLNTQWIFLKIKSCYPAIYIIHLIRGSSCTSRDEWTKANRCRRHGDVAMGDWRWIYNLGGWSLKFTVYWGSNTPGFRNEGFGILKMCHGLRSTCVVMQKTCHRRRAPSKNRCIGAQQTCHRPCTTYVGIQFAQNSRSANAD